MQKFLNALCILAAAVAIYLGQTTFGLYTGFAEGARKMGNFVYTALDEDGTRSRWWVSHSDPYYNFPRFYEDLSIAMLLYILFKVIERGRWTAVISLLPLATAILLWFQADAYRGPFLQDPDKYLDPVREVSAGTEILLAVLVFLAIAQLTSIILYLRDSRAARPR